MSQHTVRARLTAAEAQRLRVNLVRVAGFAALLGLLMEAVFVLGGEPASLSGLSGHGLWPFMVCMAVGIGQAVSGGWPPRAAAFSLVATPLAFVLAKVLQKGMAPLLGASSPGAVLTAPLLIEAGLRALEYAVLAAALAWLVWRPWGGALAHMAVGLAIGVVFGLIIAVFLPPDSALGWVTEELIFPTGCALVIFASETLTHLMPGDAPV